MHRARQGFVKASTAQANQIRGLLAEFGIVIGQGIHQVSAKIPSILEYAENGLPMSMRHLISSLLAHFKTLDNHVEELERQIKSWHRDDEASRRLEAIPGIGPLTASALVASIGDAKNFSSGRQLAAWLGLAPKQNFSGGKERLLGISKRGDSYLRTLLIHGARAVIYRAKSSTEPTSWVAQVIKRRNINVAAVALANKNARTIWALLAYDRQYQSSYVAA